MSQDITESGWRDSNPQPLRPELPAPGVGEDYTAAQRVVEVVKSPARWGWLLYFPAAHPGLSSRSMRSWAMNRSSDP